MKPGIYTNSYGKYKMFTTIFPNKTGWNWTALADGKDELSDETGRWFYKSTGSWVFKEKHKANMKQFISPFELVGW